MAVTVEADARNVHRLTVDGEMTINTALELKNALLGPLTDCNGLEMNLAEVSEIDSAGVQLMILLKTEAQAAGKVLRITGHSPAVLEILDLYDLEGFFGDAVLIDAEE